MKTTQSSNNCRTFAKLSLALFGMVTLAPVGVAEVPSGGTSPGSSFGGSSSGGSGGFLSGPSFGGLITILDESGDASFSRSYGEGNARGEMTLDASASVQVLSQLPLQPILVGKAEADLNGRARVKLFSSWKEAAELDIHGQVQSHDYTLNSSGTGFSNIDTVASAEASISVQVAGLTLYSESWDEEEDYSTGPMSGGFGGFGGSSSSSLSLEDDITLADRLWERDVLSASQTFWIGGFIPLRVSADAGAGLEVGTGLTYSAFDHEVGVYGEAKAYVNGEVSASIDYIIIAGGVTARADFATTTASLDLGIDDDGLDGGMSISMTAIQLRLYAWVRLLWHTYTKDIYGWSSGTRTYTKTL